MPVQSRRRIDIPISTLLKVAAVAGGIWALYRLWSLVLLFGLSLLLAVVLHPLVKFAERHHVRRGFALAGLSLLVFAVFAAFSGLLLPAVGREVAGVASDLPALSHKLQEWAAHTPVVARLAQRYGGGQGEAQLTKLLGNPSLWGTVAGGAVAVPVILILALYLVADGPRVYAYFLAYVPRKNRPRVQRTADGVSKVVFAYVRGQLITSALVGVFSFVTLWALHVKAPLALALLAAVFDVVPFVGFITFTVPAVLMALTVSPSSAAIVLVLYVAYHLVENYFIIPRVYGRQMRMSTLAVLLALGVGGALSGVVGAILVLPLVAAYPIVERLWLRPKLGHDAVDDHAALDKALDDHDQAAVRRVIHGEEHPPDDRH